MAIQPRRQHGMILPNGAVANQHQLQIITREAGFSEGNIFRNGVILAIAFPGRKGGKRCAPTVSFAVLGIVTDVADRHIDRAISFVQLIAARLACTALIKRRNCAA